MTNHRCQKIRQQITDVPSDDYRRDCCMRVNRECAEVSASRVNPRRMYRVMAAKDEPLLRAPRRPRSTTHAGSVSSAQRYPLVLRRLRNQCNLVRTVTAAVAK